MLLEARSIGQLHAGSVRHHGRSKLLPHDLAQAGLLLGCEDRAPRHGQADPSGSVRRSAPARGMWGKKSSGETATPIAPAERRMRSICSNVSGLGPLLRPLIVCGFTPAASARAVCDPNFSRAVRWRSVG